MIGVFNDANERLPMVFNTGLRLNEPIAGNPLHIFEVNSVMVRDVFSGTTEPRSIGDGTEIYAVRKSAKIIRIDGIARAPSFAALFDMQSELRSELDPARLSMLDEIGHGVAPFEFTTLSASGDQESYVLARPVSNPDYLFDQYLGMNAPFRIELFCADPRRYLATAVVHTIVGTNGITAVNNGNYPSTPGISIAMSGAGSSVFRIRNTTHSPDGEIWLDLDGVLAGDVVVVYPNEKVVMLNGARADHLVGNGTNWELSLLVGNNDISVTSGTNATVTFTAYSTFSM